MPYSVYIHITPNDKYYVGITSMPCVKRWNYGNGYKSCSYFDKAIKKYGWNNIDHIILLENLTKESAEFYEQYFISFFETTNPNLGYNIERGGYTHLHSDETKKRIGDKVRGKLNGMYGVQRFGEENPMYGKPAPNRGKHHSLETRNKISKSRAKYIGNKNPSAKSVECITTGKVFDTLKEAGEYYNVFPCNISTSCRKGYSCGKYNGEKLYWKYKEDVNDW